MITKYEEYVNEGLYDWFKDEYNNDYVTGAVIASFSTIIFWFFKEISEQPTVDLVLLILILILYLPMLRILTKETLRSTYHRLRTKLLSKKTNLEYKKAQEFIEKYPDLEIKLKDIKFKMIQAVKSRRNKDISAVIHDMYDLKKEINRREKLDNFFILSQEERQEMRNKEKEKEKIDPFGEENWNESFKFLENNEYAQIDPFGEEEWEDSYIYISDLNINDILRSRTELNDFYYVHKILKKSVILINKLDHNQYIVNENELNDYFEFVKKQYQHA